MKDVGSVVPASKLVTSNATGLSVDNLQSVLSWSKWILQHTEESLSYIAYTMNYVNFKKQG